MDCITKGIWCTSLVELIVMYEQEQILARNVMAVNISCSFSAMFCCPAWFCSFIVIFYELNLACSLHGTLPKHQSCTNVSHNSCSFVVLKVHTVSLLSGWLWSCSVSLISVIYMDWILPVSTDSSPEFSYIMLYITWILFACFFHVTASFRKFIISFINLSVLKGSFVVIVRCSHVLQLSETNIGFSRTALSWLEFVSVFLAFTKLTVYVF